LEEALPELLMEYQIIHQTGKDDFKNTQMLVDATLADHPYRYRYHIFDELNELSLKMLAGISDLVVTRAGSTLFEVAYWELPSIIIPKTDKKHFYQVKNAYHYAREGGCVVIEENNLTDQGLIFEINRIINNEAVKMEMVEGARRFAIKDAGEKIAREITKIALSHEI